MFYKKYTYKCNTGTDAIKTVLIKCNAKTVIIPSYTCQDLVTACQMAGASFIIVDCEDNLQISPTAVSRIPESDFDTIIVPHMFGIQAPVKQLRAKYPNKIIIEDCSQGHGLPDIGTYSDYVVTSVNKGKWLTGPHCGLIYSAINLFSELADDDFVKSLHNDITKIVKDRKERARELQNAGIKLIGEDQANVYLRGMYYTSAQKRIPYIPLHDIYTEFQCTNVDKFKNNIDWISIHI